MIVWNAIDHVSVNDDTPFSLFEGNYTHNTVSDVLRRGVQVLTQQL